MAGLYSRLDQRNPNLDIRDRPLGYKICCHIVLLALAYLFFGFSLYNFIFPYFGTLPSYLVAFLTVLGFSFCVFFLWSKVVFDSFYRRCLTSTEFSVYLVITALPGIAFITYLFPYQGELDPRRHEDIFIFLPVTVGAMLSFIFLNFTLKIISIRKQLCQVMLRRSFFF